MLTTVISGYKVWLTYNYSEVNMDENNTLTLTELAKYIGIARRTLYTMIQDGRFPVAPIKGTQPRRWNVEDVDEWRFGGKEDEQA